VVYSNKVTSQTINSAEKLIKYLHVTESDEEFLLLVQKLLHRQQKNVISYQE
jgi:hypothetical protein